MGRPLATLLPLLTAGLTILPGCLVVPATISHTPSEHPQTATRPATGESFATHQNITRPGEVIRVHETSTAQTTIPLPMIPDLPSTTPVEAVLPPSVPDSRIALSTPPPPDPPLVAAVRDYLENRPDRAVEHLRGLEPANQDLLLRLLPAVAHAQQARLNDPSDAGDLAIKVEAAAEAVARLAPLRVTKACFVERVKQFGVYDALPAGYAFLPGGTVLLYVELQNAPSDPTPHPSGGDGYVTRLNCELRLRDAAGELLAGYDPETVRGMKVNDFTRSQLRDVFLVSRFQVPQTPGTYTVEFIVRDPANGRTARKVIELLVRP